ncbi:MAG: hypothetical protein MJ178_05515 [Treponemataceae bacterium]|nr:hypothetical protein [Treponemataceae bacterium]
MGSTTIMINTYNESKLHRTLKELYQIQGDGETEVPIGTYICDVVEKSGNVVEIQTKNLGKLMAKLYALHEAGRKVLLVHPLPAVTIIETCTEDGEPVSRRKSPKKQNWYTLFTELMGIYPLLTENWFQLEVLLVTVKEKRIRTAEPVQLKNNSRRFKKNWYREDKELIEITETRRFSCPQDYLALLPEHPDVFCAKDLAGLAGANTAHKIIWVLKKAGIIAPVKKEGRTTYYGVVQ